MTLKIELKFMLNCRFFCREILKWKYNYYEQFPREHNDFTGSLKRCKLPKNSFQFKKFWRFEMDDKYFLEMLHVQKRFLLNEIAKLDKLKEVPKNYIDTEKLLHNYDQEMASMIKRVRDNFLLYMDLPNTYPNIEQEKMAFLNKINENMDLDFRKYWNSRIADLCDEEIERQKRQIQKNWKKLVPTYYNDVNKVTEELTSLLISEDDDENDTAFKDVKKDMRKKYDSGYNDDEDMTTID